MVSPASLSIHADLDFPALNGEMFTLFRPSWPRMLSAIFSRVPNGIVSDYRRYRYSRQWRFQHGAGSVADRSFLPGADPVLRWDEVSRRGRLD